MPLITDGVRESADRCRQCALLKMMKLSEIRFHRHGVLYDEATKAIDLVRNGIIWASCRMCKHGKSFQKVYGVMPSEFFSKENEKKAE